MPSDGFVLDHKPVFDWNRVPLGRVETTRRDAKTGTAKQIVLSLSPEAQSTLGTSETTVELPASLVFGMRRDGVTLDRSISELKKIEFFSSVIKK